MSKLLYAEFIRLTKSLIFKLCLLFSAGLGIFVVLMRYLDVRQNPDLYAQLSADYSNADGLLFIGSLYLIFAVAVLVGIFVGTEYSDGTIRNKLMAGHTRGTLYLSKLAVCVVAGAVVNVLYILVVLISGRLLIGGTTIPALQILAFTAVSTFVMLALTALLLLFSMLIQSKALGSVACLLVTIVMLFSAMVIMEKLSEPEYYDAYMYVNEETGETVEMEKEKNPRYLTGTAREVYEFLNNFLPVSQLYQIGMNNVDKLGLIVVYDCAIIILTTGAGMLFFRKKNLK